MKTLSIVALFALVATPTLAGAQEAPFNAREAVSIKVSTSGLDLNTARGQQQLRSRMKRAIEATCRPSDVYSSYQSEDNQCFQEMALSANSQIQSYAQNADNRAVGKN